MGNFTESGIQVDGYSLEVNGTATAEDEATVAATYTEGTITTAALVNNYTRKTSSVKVTKARSILDSPTAAGTARKDSAA